MSRWQPVIGLEIHAQLQTARKLFSATRLPLPNASPNTAVTWYDAAMPGTLPRLNANALRQAIKAGIAFNGRINNESRFVRKHYFYGDMPAGYQITQQDQPIVSNGSVELDDGTAIRIERIQLEQDSGKTVTDLDPCYNFLDLNRAGVPLIEIVTAPDIRNSTHAVQVVKEIQKLLTYLGISDGVMANGNLRVDVNVSMEDSESPEKSGDRVEIKNLNSLKSIEKAINFEIGRQTECFHQGFAVSRETRSFDAALGITQMTRSKEQVKDYRMFNDPDLPLLRLDDDFIERIRKVLPELPKLAASRLQKQYNLNKSAARTIASDLAISNYFHQVMAIRPKTTDSGITTANWMINELFGRLAASNIPISSCPVSPDRFRNLIDAILTSIISGPAAKSLLDVLMTEDSRSVTEIIQANNWNQVSDSEVLEPICKRVIDDFPKEVNDYLVKGNKRKLNFLVSESRKRIGDQANLSVVNSILSDLLGQIKSK